MILLVVLAVDLLIDRVFKMDFAQRTIMLVAMGAVASVLFYWRLIRPLMFRPTTDALVYEVEEKNQDLKESLISAVQLSRRGDLTGLGFSPSLATATIERGISQAESINFGTAIDSKRNASNWGLLLLAMGLFVALGVGIAQSTFLATWFNRNLMLGSAQWPQSTYLIIQGVENGQLVLPRGIDHRQLVEVSPDSRVKDVEVSIEIDGPSGTSFNPMKATGKKDGTEFAFIFHNVSAEFRFRARGGDDVSKWVSVTLVEPPSIGQLELSVRMPAYTGVESLPLVGNGPHSVLAGSQLLVRATSNKPLRECLVELGDETFVLKAGADGKTFVGEIPGDGKTLAGGEYAFRLTDQTGLQSIRPTKFSISTREDAPPKVRASLLGSSGVVVPRARIPVSLDAKDDFAITKLEFACQWKSGDDENMKAGSARVDVGPLTSEPNETVTELADVRVLDLIPLKLEAGTSFRLTLEATDNRPETPGVGVSQEFLLRIVTGEELRADLLRREIEQRKAFEQAYDAQLELMAELQAVAAMKPRAGQDQPNFDNEREKRMIALTREQKGIGTSLNRIGNRFEEFLVEVKNNRLDEQENELAPEQRIEKRFDEGIIRPIRELDQDFVSLATRHIDNCRRAATKPVELRESVEATVAVQQEILSRMKRILNSMMDSENFQEVINKLLEISAAEKRLIQESKDRSKPGDIFDDTDDIFDKE